MTGSLPARITDWLAAEGPQGPYLVTGSASSLAAFTESLQAAVPNVHDTMLVAGDERSIKVKHIRELRSHIRSTTFSGQRLIIIQHAERLGREAAGMLLKELEESSRTNRFVLTSAFPGRLLPTILSRCEVLRLSADTIVVPADEAFGDVLHQAADRVKRDPYSDTQLEDIAGALSAWVRRQPGNPALARTLLRLRDTYKLKAGGGNTKLASDVLQASLQVLLDTKRA